MSFFPIDLTIEERELEPASEDVPSQESAPEEHSTRAPEPSTSGIQKHWKKQKASESMMELSDDDAVVSSEQVSLTYSCDI